MIDEALHKNLKASLIAEANQLKSELSGIAKKDPKMRNDWDATFPTAEDARGSGHAALEEQADLREEYETNVAQEHVLELRLRDVERAIERIDTPEYGRCKACGKDIPLDRLQANPAAEYDIDHQPRD